MALTKQQFLLAKLAEECSEVAQRALKSQQFGLDERQSDMHQNNADRLDGELNDLMAILKMLRDELIYNFVEDDLAIDAKIEKVEKYLEYSRKLGKVM